MSIWNKRNYTYEEGTELLQKLRYDLEQHSKHECSPQCPMKKNDLIKKINIVRQRTAKPT